jgi:hypothetical protein
MFVLSISALPKNALFNNSVSEAYYAFYLRSKARLLRTRPMSDAPSSGPTTEPLPNYNVLRPSLLDNKLVRASLLSLVLIALALGVSWITWETPVPQMQQGTTFGQVKITIVKPPVIPPAPNDAGGSQSVMPLPIVPAPPAVITAIHPNISFTIPKADLPNGADFLSPEAISGSRGGSGQGAGSGSGNGNDAGAGQGDNILGGVGQDTKTSVIVDVSNSMLKFDSAIENYIDSHFRHADYCSAPNALGGDLPQYAALTSKPHYHGKNSEPMPQEIGQADLYDSVYLELADHPQVVVIVSDYEDGYLPDATAALIATLRSNHIKLFILTREMAAYPGLAEYSKESGGGYSLLRIDEKSQSIVGVESNPTVTGSPQLSPNYATKRDHNTPDWMVRNIPATH